MLRTRLINVIVVALSAAAAGRFRRRVVTIRTAGFVHWSKAAFKLVWIRLPIRCGGVRFFVESVAGGTVLQARQNDVGVVREFRKRLAGASF